MVTTQPSPHLTVELAGRYGQLTLNRPDDNRLTDDMMIALRDSLREAGRAVDYLVIQSVGRHFCLGRDRGGSSTMSQSESLALAMDVNRALSEVPALVIAAVRGNAIGFGAGLVVQCDLAVASGDAVFGFDEIEHGFPPMIVMSYLGRHLLPKHVNGLIFTGRKLTASQAAAIGLVNSVVPNHDLSHAIDGLVRQLDALDGNAIRSAKKYLADIQGVELSSRPDFALRSQIDWFARQAP